MVWSKRRDWCCHVLYIGLHALYKCTGSLTWPQLALAARRRAISARGPHSLNVGGVMYIFAVCCECGAGECGAGFSRVFEVYHC